MKKIFTSVTAVIASVIPLTSYAQANPLVAASGTFGDIITAITKNILGALTTLFASAALAAFFFGIVKFILGLRNGVEKDVTNGKQFMLWGLIALFVMFSVWGIIRYGQTILGLPQGSNIVIPTIRFEGGPNTNTSNTNTTNTNTGGYTAPTNTNPLGGGSGSQTGSSICLAYGPGTGCTTSNGVSGTCNASNVCVVNSSTGGGGLTCSRYDSFGTCCDQDYQYVDDSGICQTAFN